MINEQKDISGALYSELARVGKSLSNEKRLQLLDLLTQGPKTVEELSKLSDMSVANTSRHLQILRAGNLVNRTKNKNYVVYSLASKKIVDLVYLLRDVGEEQLSEMQNLRSKLDDDVYTLTIQEAYDKLQAGQIELLDIRSNDEYLSGHIKGSVNIPAEKLAEKMNDLPSDKDVAVYCRGHLCTLTNKASKFLNQHGHRAYSLNESYYDWEKFIESNALT